MDDGLHIQNLPDWRYAGKHVDSAVTSTRLKEDDLDIAIILQPARRDGDHVARKEYIVENGYLIPRYQTSERNYRRREEELLIDRVLRFFYSCEPGLDTERTGDQIDRELGLFDDTLREINQQRHSAGLPDFDFSTPEREMTALERQLVAIGANFVGHAVNRLGRLGRIILQGNRDGVKFEHDDAYISKNMDQVKSEFSDLWLKLAVTQKDIVRCVKTRDLKPDYDGIFADLIREIGKPVMPTVQDGKQSIHAKPDAERQARKNIITKIGYTLEAIDETAAAVRELYQSEDFSKIIKKATAAFNKKQEASPQTPDNDLSPSNYRGLLQEFVEVSRARACLKSEDADNFNIVAARLKFLQNELGLLHEALFTSTSYRVMERSSHDPLAERSIQLLKRGVALIGEMAELRMPKNHKSLDVYDTEKPDFQNRDPSSVGRLKEEIHEWIQKCEDRKRGRGFNME